MTFITKKDGDMPASQPVQQVQTAQPVPSAPQFSGARAAAPTLAPLAPLRSLSPEPMAMAMSPRAMSPAPMVAEGATNGVAVAAPGYIPKAGKLTVEDIEAERALLMERMDFLNNALDELKKEQM